MIDWQNKRVVVDGIGQEGQAMVEYLLGEGAHVTVCDEREPEALGEIYLAWQSRGVAWQLGPAYLQDLTSFSVVVRSPGVSPHLQPLKAAMKRGVTVTSLTKIFFELCPCPIIGVTGTKGKGTTSTLIWKMLTAARKKVVLVGNIGAPAISVLADLTPKHTVVYELSSFQLQDLDRSPHIAVALGITLEHQDYHRSPEEYYAAKANIVRYQTPNDIAVLNTDYPTTATFRPLVRGQAFTVTRGYLAGDGVAITPEGVVRHSHGKVDRICRREEVRLKGDHNLENVAAAVAAASAAGVSVAAMRRVIREFSGLPHRLEFVADVSGVEYWNDTYGTTPEGVIAAVRSFTEPIVLLLGGSEKGLTYEVLADVIVKSTVKTIVGIGLSAEKIYAVVKQAATKTGLKAPAYVEGGATMEAMLKTARKFAKSGDAVLLSPAAASFDRFKNASDRGDQFRDVVHSLTTPQE